MQILFSEKNIFVSPKGKHIRHPVNVTTNNQSTKRMKKNIKSIVKTNCSGRINRDANPLIHKMLTD